MKRGRTTLAATAVVAALFLLAMGAPVASADTFTYTLNQFNVSGFTGPYVQAVVNRTSSTTATITFTSLVNGGDIYLMGDGGSVGVNVNAASWTLSSITGSNAGTGFSPGPYSNAGSGNEDGWGSFNQRISASCGFPCSASSISFKLTDKSGTWATAANVLTGNAGGYSVAAHIFATPNPAVRANGAINTGFATNGPAAVPDGGVTLMLLGGALVGLATLRRKFRV